MCLGDTEAQVTVYLCPLASSQLSPLDITPPTVLSARKISASGRNGRKTKGIGRIAKANQRKQVKIGKVGDKFQSTRIIFLEHLTITTGSTTMEKALRFPLLFTWKKDVTSQGDMIGPRCRPLRFLHESHYSLLVSDGLFDCVPRKWSWHFQ